MSPGETADRLTSRVSLTGSLLPMRPAAEIERFERFVTDREFRGYAYRL